jgi:hypothetical protein
VPCADATIFLPGKRESDDRRTYEPDAGRFLGPTVRSSEPRARRRGRWAAETDRTIVRPPPVLASGTSDCAIAARIKARTAGVFNVAALGSRT